MFANAIGRNKSPFTALRLWMEEISAKLKKSLPPEIGPAVSIVLDVFTQKVEEYTENPAGLLKFFRMAI